MIICRRPPAKALITAVLCMVSAGAAGCGSTVAAPNATGSGLSSTGGLGAPTAPGSLPARDGVAGSGSAGLASSTAAATGPVGGANGVGGAAGAANTQQLASTVGTAVAGRSGSVQIGFLVTKCSNCNLLGSKYTQTAHSEQDVLQAFVNDQNSRGGVLGHKIVPVFATEDTASPDFSSMLQSICATFTQDHHVAAVVGAGFGYSDILGDCLAKASIPIVDAMRTTGVPDSQNLRTHPGYVVSGEPELDVYTSAAYTSAITDGWLSPKTKLGVLNYGCPGATRVWKKVIQPYLAAHYITVADEYTASCLSGASDVSKAAQDVQQAELRMRAKGVDTVAITDIPLVVFAEDAESQHYYPKYLATEGGGSSYETLLPSTQAVNVHAPGWEPTYDLDAAHQLPLNAQQHVCLAALNRGGFGAPTASEYGTYFSLCGGWQLYLQAMGRAGDFAGTRVIAAVESLASSFVNPVLLDGQTLLGRDKHAAATRYRTELYNTGCSCFQYVGPTRPLPQLG